MGPCSMDLRKRVVAACSRSGKGRKQIVDESEVGTASGLPRTLWAVTVRKRTPRRYTLSAAR